MRTAGFVAVSVAAAAVALMPTAVTGKRKPFDYGPPPDRAEYRRLGKAALRAALPDQEKWAVESPNGAIAYTWDHKGNYPGYMTCGVMRAIAPVTGRYPLTNFIVVIDRGVVKNVDIAVKARNDIRNQVCIDRFARGMFPPARLMGPAVSRASAPSSTSTAPLDQLAIAPLGVTIRPMPEGAYVISADPGSAGQRAGLSAGVVITSVNAIPLPGMGAAMVQLLGSDAPVMTIETAAGAHLELRRVPRVHGGQV